MNLLRIHLLDLTILGQTFIEMHVLILILTFVCSFLNFNVENPLQVLVL